MSLEAALARDPGIPVGPGLAVTFGYSEAGEQTAVLLRHPHARTGAPCLLHVWLEGCGCAVSPHRVVQQSPLTVAPALACPRCGLRGVIKGGVWRAER